MSDTQSTEKIQHLRKNEVWSIGDITWIMLGHEDCSSHFSRRIKSCEEEYNYWELPEKAKACVDLFDEMMDRFNSGHFGRLFVEYMDEFDDWNAIHRLRVVDWINDTEILESVKFKENHHLQTQKKLLKLFDTIHSKRPDKNDDIHKIDFVELIRSDFWVLTELRIVLFGETYLEKYQPHFYQKFIPEIEGQKKRVDQLIENALILDEVKKYTSPSFRQPLITYIEGGDYIDLHPDDDTYIGVYDSTELETGCKIYQPIELLKALKSKRYPISSDLITALESRKHTASSLLQELPKLMEGFLKQGASELEGHHIRETSPLKAPEGTLWDEIGFTLLPGGNVKIKIKSNIKTLTLEQLTQVMSGEKTRDLLLHILNLSGQFSRKQLKGKALENYKSYISALRKDLKNLFQIEDDPIDSIGHGSYVTKFSASRQPPSDSF